MDDKLKVDYEELEEAISRIRRAYKVFSNFSENGFDTEIEYLDEMNSDFVDKLEQVLRIAKKWNVKRINKNIKKYMRKAESIYQEIKEMDENLTDIE